MKTSFTISDLDDYESLLANASKGRPIYLSVNGKKKYVILDIEDEEKYETRKAFFNLLVQLNNGHNAGVKNGYISSKDVQSYFKNKKM